MAEKIFSFIICIPLFAALLWAFFDPRESLLFGRRWMYEEEPEPSEAAIFFTKVLSAICLIILALIFIVSFFN